MLEALVCQRCARRCPVGLGGVCECGGLLLAAYAPSGRRPEEGGGLWSWGDLLPPCEPVSLGEPETPLAEAPASLRVAGRVLLKDDGGLPTGTFKARGAAVGVAMARALGARGVALPSAGNAGAAWAAYCAAADLPCAVWMAEDAPPETVTQAEAHGAEVHVVRGTISEAGAAAAAEAARRGWHLAATFREPWRVEGKKTALFEVARALGWKLPDAAVLPVGGGVGAVAWHKAAAELRAVGWAAGAMRLYAVQSEGCAPIVRAFDRGAGDVERWGDPRTAAAGIRVPAPLAGGLVLRALRESGGGAIAVPEDRIRSAQEWLAGRHEPAVALEAAAAWAGYETLARAGAFANDQNVVVYLTGSASAPAVA